MNKDLFGCKNGVYDIVSDEFRKYRFDDYVTMSCGFDFGLVGSVCAYTPDVIASAANTKIIFFILSFFKLI